MPLNARTLAVGVTVLAWLGQGLARADRPGAHETARCTQGFERGQEQRQQGQLLAARASFEVCARPVCPAVVSRECVRWLDEVRAEVPRLTVQVRDGEVASVLLDGQPVGPAPASLEVDPGTHRVAARTARGDGTATSVVVAASAVASVTVDGPPRPAPAASLPASAPAATGLLGPRGPSYALFGLGALALGAGVWLGVSTWSDVKERREALDRGETTPQDTVDRLRLRLNIADALMGTGLVAGGVGLFLFLRTGPSVALSPRPGGVTATIQF